MIIDQFDEMRSARDEQPVVMSVVLHSFISGQPFRLRALSSRGRAHPRFRRDAMGLRSLGRSHGSASTLRRSSEAMRYIARKQQNGIRPADRDSGARRAHSLSARNAGIRRRFRFPVIYERVEGVTTRTA